MIVEWPGVIIAFLLFYTVSRGLLKKDRKKEVTVEQLQAMIKKAKFEIKD